MITKPSFDIQIPVHSARTIDLNSYLLQVFNMALLKLDKIEEFP